MKDQTGHCLQHRRWRRVNRSWRSWESSKDRLTKIDNGKIKPESRKVLCTENTPGVKQGHHGILLSFNTEGSDNFKTLISVKLSKTLVFETKTRIERTRGLTLPNSSLIQNVEKGTQYLTWRGKRNVNRAQLEYHYHLLRQRPLEPITDWLQFQRVSTKKCRKICSLVIMVDLTNKIYKTSIMFIRDIMSSSFTWPIRVYPCTR